MFILPQQFCWTECRLSSYAHTKCIVTSLGRHQQKWFSVESAPGNTLGPTKQHSSSIRKLGLNAGTGPIGTNLKCLKRSSWFWNRFPRSIYPLGFSAEFPKVRSWIMIILADFMMLKFKLKLICGCNMQRAGLEPRMSHVLLCYYSLSGRSHDPSKICLSAPCTSSRGNPDRSAPQGDLNQYC